MARTVSADTLVMAGGTTVSVAALALVLSGVQTTALSITSDEAAPQIELQDTGADSWIEFAPVSADAHVPTSGIRVTSNVLNNHEDQVMTIGHSVRGGAELGKVGWWWQLEHSFKASPDPENETILSEGFLQWRSPAGLQLRPIGCTVDWDTELIVCGTIGEFQWSDEAGTSLGRFDRSGMLDMQAAAGGFRKVGNNTGVLYGQKTPASGGGLFEFIRVHDSNWILFDVNQQYGGLRTSSPGGFYAGLGNPQANAKLQIDSTAKGALLPRMTTAQRNAVTWTAGDEGMEIYNDTLNKKQVWNGASWETITSVAE